MENTRKKLFLLDAYALIYRAFFAMNKNPRMTSKGLNTSAIMGFLNSLYEILQKENPTHIGVAFDVAGTAQRQAEYSEYKANREKMPDDLRESIPYIIKLIEAGLISRPEKGVYAKNTLEPHTAEAVAIYKKSFFINNPKARENYAVEDSSYWEYLQG